MFDFIIDSLDDIDVFRKIPLYDMIIEWIHDDSGNNVMYKKMATKDIQILNYIK